MTDSTDDVDYYDGDDEDDFDYDFLNTRIIRLEIEIAKLQYMVNGIMNHLKGRTE